MNDEVHKVVMLSPEIIRLDNELSQQLNQIDNVRLQIADHENKRNDHNVVMANHTGYQPQSVYDEAKRGYHAEGKTISELTRELQPLERGHASLQRQRGERYRELCTREAKKQYESLTIVGLNKLNKQLSKKIAALNSDADKVRKALAEVEKVASEQDERQSGHDRYKSEYLASKQELEQAEADRALNSSLPNPTGLRSRVAEAKRKYEHCLKQLPTQALLNSIANKRESLQVDLASFEVDIESLTSDMWVNRCLVAQIQYREKLYELLPLVKEMIVCDKMSNSKSNVGEVLLDRLKNKGLSLPVIFDDRSLGHNALSPIFNGILDNLDKVHASISAELKVESL